MQDDIFILGDADGYDAAYDWLLPFGLKVDWNTSTFPIMPETETTAISLPGVEGEIVQETKYKERPVVLTCFSEEGLTRAEVNQLKTQITEYLNSTKDETKKMLVTSRNLYFDVKYDGSAVITGQKNYVKATIPFTASIYGKSATEHSLDGDGDITNTGITDIGLIHTISGGVSNPQFLVGDNLFAWNGYIPPDYELIINQATLTCYLLSSDGTKTNAMQKLTGSFKKLAPGETLTIECADEQTKNSLKTTWEVLKLW